VSPSSHLKTKTDPVSKMLHFPVIQNFGRWIKAIHPVILTRTLFETSPPTVSNELKCNLIHYLNSSIINVSLHTGVRCKEPNYCFLLSCLADIPDATCSSNRYNGFFSSVLLRVFSVFTRNNVVIHFILVTYQRAFVIIRSILDWLRCILAICDLLAHPHSSRMSSKKKV
jgi:hypothetical protein